MISYFDHFFEYLGGVDAELCDVLSRITQQVIEQTSHGDLDRWLGAVETMPAIKPSSIDIDASAVRIGCAGDCDDATRQAFIETLMTLHPWRKGPFEVFGIDIETEWRSDLKWDRVKDAIAPLADKVVLDVGSGNGYFGFRMIGAGAKTVVAIDPFLLFVVQFLAINRYVNSSQLAVLPLKIEDLPKTRAHFDTVFSMGVLYHRRDPVAHLRDLYDLTLPGGEVVLETLVIDSAGEDMLQPKGRYAKMRNVWAIPSPALGQKWLEEAGFCHVKIVDVTPTTTEEQRPTEWMHFESLPDYLHPQDESKTIEGCPAPVRGTFIGRKL